MTDSPAVSGIPRLILRAEGLAICGLAILLYSKAGDSWWLFAILFLAPDLSFLGYLGGARMGAGSEPTITLQDAEAIKPLAAATPASS